MPRDWSDPSPSLNWRLTRSNDTLLNSSPIKPRLQTKLDDGHSSMFQTLQTKIRTRPRNNNMSKKRNKNSYDDDDLPRKKVEKGLNKVDKYKKRIYNMAASLDPDDEAFDEYLDNEAVQYKRFKLR